MRVYSVVTLLGFTFLTMQACERVALEPDNVTRGELVRGNYKTDASKSCVGQCGAKAPGGCWCDEKCAQFGDCCADKGSACDGAALTCQGACGEQAASGCWCDAECERFGDCCPDKLERCGNS